MFRHSYNIGKHIGIVLVVMVVMTLVVGNMMSATPVFGAHHALAQATNTTTNGNGVLDTIGGAKLPVVGNILKSISYFYLVVAAFLIKLAAFLAGAAIKFNQSILNFDPPFVVTGWQVFRDLTNLGFVFGIIVIAIATILRRKTYSAQSILWKLVVAALLVNFSLAIGSAIIKTSDVFSNYFLDQIAGGDVGTATLKIADQFRLQDFYSPKKSIADSIPIIGASNSYVRIAGIIAKKILKTYEGSPDLFELVGMSIGILLESIVFLVLLGFAGMLLLRYFYLSFLLMLSPIVWLLWIFPNTQKHWREWWQKFIHWVVYAPTILFFLWLTLVVMKEGTKYAQQARDAIVSSNNVNSAALIGNVDFGFVMTTIMAMGMLIGGMKAASAMGYGGTSLAMGAANKTVEKTKDWAKGRAQRYGKRVGGVGMRGVGRAITEPKSKFAKVITAPLRKGPLKGLAGRASVALEAKGEKWGRADIDYYRAAHKDYSTAQKEKLLETQTGVQYAATLADLAQQGELKETANPKENERRRRVQKKLRALGMGDKSSEIKGIDVASGGTEEMDGYEAELNNLEKGSAEFKRVAEQLEEATKKFISSLKPNEVKKVISGMLKRDKIHGNENGFATYRDAVIRHINEDTSGGSFYGAFQGAKKPDDIKRLVSLLAISVGAMTLDEAEEKIMKEGDYKAVIEQLNKKETAVAKRLKNRLEKSIYGDAAFFSPKDEKKEAKKESGDDNKKSSK